jgi:hypothetical protein
MPRIPMLEERLRQVRSLVSRRATGEGRIFHLTVRSVYRPEGLGILGCSDLTAGCIDEQQLAYVEPRRDPEAVPYWDLVNGEYLFQFNETLVLAENELALIRPLDELMAGGGTHPIVCLGELSEAMLMPMLVSHSGIRIHQNARISLVTIVPI